MGNTVKAMFVNGSPRKGWNTAKMLESAMQGATEAGAECEMVHLYVINFHGCKSCFACKLKNSKTNGVCAIRDEHFATDLANARDLGRRLVEMAKN